jgi:hypothetical protein
MPGKGALRIIRVQGHTLSRPVTVPTTPILIEVGPVSDGGGPSSDKSPVLLTKNGFPVTATASVTASLKEEDAAIFLAAGMLQTKQLEKQLRSLLRSRLKEGVAATDYLDLEAGVRKHIEEHLSFDAHGYTVVLPVEVHITTLNVTDAAVAGADQIRAHEALTKYANDAAVREATSSEDRKVKEAEIAGANQERQQATALQQHVDEQARTLAELTKDRQIAIRRSEDATLSAGRQHTFDLGQQTLRVAKLEGSVDGDRLQSEADERSDLARATRDAHRRLAVAAGERAEQAIRLEAEAARLRKALEVAKETLGVRKTELEQNATFLQGDLAFQLRTKILDAAKDIGQAQAKAAGAVLGSGRLTVIGDPTALSSVAKNYAEGAGLAVRIRELLAVLDDAEVQDTLGSTIRTLTAAATGAPPSGSAHTSGQRPPTESAGDADFQP